MKDLEAEYSFHKVTYNFMSRLRPSHKGNTYMIVAEIKRKKEKR